MDLLFIVDAVTVHTHTGTVGHLVLFKSGMILITPLGQPACIRASHWECSKSFLSASCLEIHRVVAKHGNGPGLQISLQCLPRDSVCPDRVCPSWGVCFPLLLFFYAVDVVWRRQWRWVLFLVLWISGADAVIRGTWKMIWLFTSGSLVHSELSF